MIIKAKLRQILDKKLHETMQNIMTKWPDYADIHVFVKISKAIEAEVKDYMDSYKNLVEQIGYSLKDGKSVSAEEITNSLLYEFGKTQADGKMSLVGVSEKDNEDFMVQKDIADACIRAFNKAHDALLDEEVEIQIPRKIKVTEKIFKKDVINAYDCFILEPILELNEIPVLTEA